MNSSVRPLKNASNTLNVGRGALTAKPARLPAVVLTFTSDQATLSGDRLTFTNAQDNYPSERDKNPGERDNYPDEPLTHTVHRDALTLKQNAFLGEWAPLNQVSFSCNVQDLTHPVQQYTLTDDRDKNTSDRDTYICQPDKNTDKRDNYPGERETPTNHRKKRPMKHSPLITHH